MQQLSIGDLRASANGLGGMPMSVEGRPDGALLAVVDAERMRVRFYRVPAN